MKLYSHDIFCQNSSVWNRFQLYNVNKGKLWVTNTKKCDKSAKQKLDADTNQRKTNILNKQKK